METLEDVRKLSIIWGISLQKTLRVMGNFKKIKSLNDKVYDIDKKRDLLLKKNSSILSADNCSASWIQWTDVKRGFLVLLFCLSFFSSAFAEETEIDRMMEQSFQTHLEQSEALNAGYTAERAGWDAERNDE